MHQTHQQAPADQFNAFCDRLDWQPLSPTNAIATASTNVNNELVTIFAERFARAGCFAVKLSFHHENMSPGHFLGALILDSPGDRVDSKIPKHKTNPRRSLPNDFELARRQTVAESLWAALVAAEPTDASS